jgi:tetratricopeptide (TPR) repeat protein
VIGCEKRAKGCILKFLFLFFLSFPLILAGSEEKLKLALSQYESGEYQLAARNLFSLLYPLKLKKIKNIKKAHLYLGFCYVYQGKKKEAQQEFIEVLKLDEDFELSEDFFSPKVIKIFQKAREEFQKLKPEPSLPPTPPSSLPGVEIFTRPAPKKTPFLVKFCPFGFLELQRGEKVKGISFFSLQFISLSMSYLAYVLFEREKNPLTQTPRDFEKARQWQKVQQISFGVFFLSYAANIFDRFFLSQE